MKKALANRIKITGRGKLMRRKMGIGHSLAKKNSRQIHRRRGSLLVHATDVKMFRKYL